MSFLSTLGEALIKTLERIRIVLAPLSDRLLDRLTGKRITDASSQAAGMRSFELDADAVMSQEHTHRAQTLVRSAVLVVGMLLVWAGLAQIDEVTKGDAKVISSKQLQVVQSLDGGVVTEILAKEGEVVEAGQLLLKIDETRATSGVRESAAQAFALQTKLARLKALAEGHSFKPPTPRPDNKEEVRIVEEERQLYDARRSELEALISISQQQLAQRQQELSEAQYKRAQLPARSRASISEATRKIQETELSFRNDTRKELSEVLGRLNAINEGAVALADKVAKSQVKSPVRGRIQRLLANTVGGVLSPGKDIVEIVPLDDALVLEAKVQPRDIAFIHPGQAATVKFTAYDFSIYGGLDAVVENISPDTVTDERGNNTFYIVRVRTHQTNFSAKMPIIPGMTAEVDVLTGKKTVLSYLLKPVLKARAYSLRER